MTESTPRHGHAPIPMRLRARGEGHEKPGDFSWEVTPAGHRRMWLAIPSGDPDEAREVIYLPVADLCQTPKCWNWNKDDTKPTLTPSVHTIGHWHGWVRNGELVEA